MRYRTYIHICVPGTEPAAHLGVAAELSESERDEVGRELSASTYGSFTLDDGTELAIPAGIYQHVYIRMVPDDNLNEAA
jgi:hypothetical protein